MLIEQIIELELRVPETHGRTYVPKTSYFCDKTKNLHGKSSRELFRAKNVRKAMYLVYSSLGQLTKFNPKILNVFWT